MQTQTSPFIDDPTEILEINLKKISAFYEIFRVEDMLISLTQVETYKIWDPREGKKNEIMRYHNGPIKV